MSISFYVHEKDNGVVHSQQHTLDIPCQDQCQTVPASSHRQQRVPLVRQARELWDISQLKSVDSFLALS